MSYVLRCVLFFFLKLDKSIKFADHKHYCEMNLVIGFVILEWDMRVGITEERPLNLRENHRFSSF